MADRPAQPLGWEHNMSEILRWVLCNTADEYVGTEYDNYQEARDAAAASAEPVAVVELTYEFSDSALVWTPEGGEHASILTWPPTPNTDDPAVEAAVCRHCTQPIARRTDREWPTHWVHTDEQGGLGCADGITEADPVPTGECQWFAQCHDAATDYRTHPVLGRVPVCPTHLVWKP